MRILIAVLTCHRFRSRADVLRRTWVKDLTGADIAFFLGRNEGDPQPDEVWLDVPDDYLSLRKKTQMAFAWSVEQGYDRILKMDDDVYLIPQRLLSTVTRHDYVGRVRGASRQNDAPRIYGDLEKAFCSGFSYWVSRKAASIIAAAPDNGDWAEDRFAGNALADKGIFPVATDEFLLWPPLQGHFCTVPNPHCDFCRQVYANASVICPYDHPSVIPQLHEYFKSTGFIPTCFPEEAMK